MSSILTTGRSILAILQPMTGQRATGQCLFRPVSGAVEQVPPHVFLSPVLNGQYRPDLAFKVPKNPAEGTGGAWSIDAGGTAVPIISNLGGTRYNVPAGTLFRLEPDVGSNVVGEVVAIDNFTGGTNQWEDPDPVVSDLALTNGVLYETFGNNNSVEMFNSNIGGKFPAVMLFWSEDEPADGMLISDLNRPGKRGSTAMQYQQEFELWLVCSREDSEAQRRGQAMRLLDEISDYLYDRMGVDGLVFSSPGGINIKRRAREQGSGEQFFKAYRVYSITLSATVTQQKRDLRNPAPLVRFSANYLKQDPSFGDLPLLHDDVYPTAVPSGMWVTQYDSHQLFGFGRQQYTEVGNGTAVPATIVSIPKMGAQPNSYQSMTFAPNGDMWVGSWGNFFVEVPQVIFKLTPEQYRGGGSPPPSVVLTMPSTSADDASVDSIAFDDQGNLWASFGSSSVGRLRKFDAADLRATGTPAPSVVLQSTTYLGFPVDICFDSSGNLLVTNYYATTISKFAKVQLSTTDLAVVPAILITVGLGVNGLTFDSNGNLWVSNFDHSTISKYLAADLATTGAPTPSVVLSGINANPEKLAFDAGGNLWVTLFDTSVPGNPDGVVACFAAADLTTSGVKKPRFKLNGGGKLAIPYSVRFAPELPA